MENIVYYFAAFVTILTIGHGIVLISTSILRVIRARIRNSKDQNLLLNFCHFVNGILNLSIGIFVFWRLQPNYYSSYLTIIIIAIFSLLENMTRRYYTKRTSNENIVSDNDSDNIS